MKFDISALNNFQKKVALDESWDKELSNLRKNREIIGFWKKEKDKERREKLKRRNPGD